MIMSTKYVLIMVLNLSTSPVIQADFTSKEICEKVLVDINRQLPTKYILVQGCYPK